MAGEGTIFRDGGFREDLYYRLRVDVEREHMARVLAATGGHKTRAAEILEISRPRLARLIEKYGLE